MANEIIDRKLEQHILPYIVSGRRLKRQWFYRTNTLFGYTTDLLGMASTLGLVVPPALGALATEAAEGDSTASTVAALAELPPYLYYPALVLALVWVILRVAFARENGQKRAVLARSASNSMRQAEVMLHRHLAKADPLPDLNDLLDKHVGPAVDRTMQEEAWPWTPFSPGIDDEVKHLKAQLVNRYGNNWIAPAAMPGIQQIQKP